MNNNLKQESVKEMLNMLKGDYNFPVKLWVWGKVIKEWAGIIIGSSIFFLIALFIVLSIREERQNIKDNVNVLPMKDIVTFLAIYQRSIDKRQKVFESLMETIELYGNNKLNKESLERKISTFSSISSLCNGERGMIVKEFTRTQNPFEDPKVSTAFDKLIENPNDFFKKNNKVLDFQRENEQWGILCAFCQNEVKKANNELVQLLNEEGNAQTINQPREIRN